MQRSEVLFKYIQQVRDSIYEEFSPNHFLHFSKPTPENLAKYQILDSNKLGFLCKIFLKFTSSLVNLVFGYIYYFPEIFSRGFKIDENSSVYISHLTNNFASNFNDPFYGSALQNPVNIEHRYLLLLNGTRTNLILLKKKLPFSFPKSNIKIVAKNPSLITLARHFFGVCRNSKKYIQLFRDAKTSYARRIVVLAVLGEFERPTISNIAITETLESLVGNTAIKSVYTTFEGQLFEEKMLEIANRNLRTRFNFYQHAPIVKTQYSLLNSLSAMTSNCRVLCSGQITFDYFESTSINANKLLLKAGSAKHKTLTEEKRILGNRILLAPEGTKQASLELLNLGISLANFFSDKTFIIRLHPAIATNLDLKSLKIPDNLTLSRNVLIADLNQSNICIFRTSAVGIEAGAFGLVPIYYSEGGEDLNPLSLFHQSTLKFEDTHSLKAGLVDIVDTLHLETSLVTEFDSYFTKQDLTVFD
jgi:hypothetical protein